MKYDNTNRGTLGKNKRREKDTHAEYTGRLNVDGTDYWLSGWVKTGKDGERFFSLKVKRKDERAVDLMQADTQMAADDSDIPF